MSQQKTLFFFLYSHAIDFFYCARAKGRREKEKKERQREGKKEKEKLPRVVVVVSLAGKRKKSLEEWGSFSFVLPGVCLFFNAL